VTTDNVTSIGKTPRARPVTVLAVAVHSVSKRGLPWAAYFGNCPRCLNRRQFIRPGRRLCPCGAVLDLVTGAEVA
jgi:hypothetical protein